MVSLNHLANASKGGYRHFSVCGRTLILWDLLCVACVCATPGTGERVREIAVNTEQRRARVHYRLVNAWW